MGAFNNKRGLTEGYKVGSQTPIDDRFVFNDLTDLIDLGTGDFNAYRYYEGMIVYVIAEDTNYVWAESLTGELPTSYLYPVGIIANGVDYSSREFNFIPAGGGSTGLSKDIRASVDVGGYSIGDIALTGLEYTDFVEALIAPAVFPTMSANTLVLNGVTASTLEIGFNYSTNLSIAYNPGTIESKDGTPNVDLTGGITSTVYTGGNVDGGTGVVTGFIVVAGDTFWTATSDFAVNADPYYDSTGAQSNLFDALRGPGTIIDNSNIITGKYRYWFSVGSIPTTSVDVRALTDKGFFGSLEFDITIPMNTAEVAFYIPDTYSNVLVNYVESSSADVTGSFTEVAMNVDDGNATPVGYSRFESVIGGGGYPALATYKVTLTI